MDPPNTITLISRTPEKVSVILGKPHIGLGLRCKGLGCMGLGVGFRV